MVGRKSHPWPGILINPHVGNQARSEAKTKLRWALPVIIDLSILAVNSHDGDNIKL